MNSYDRMIEQGLISQLNSSLEYNNTELVKLKERVEYLEKQLKECRHDMDEEPHKMKIEVGKFYKTRDGRKAFVYRKYGTKFIFVIINNDSGEFSCNESGRPFDEMFYISDRDLIKEWKD